MNERYARGRAALDALAPQSAQVVQDVLADVAPDMGRFIMEFAYGDVFTRPGLARELRQTATIAALAALGNAAPQLRFHIEAGLAVGLSPQEVIEILFLTAVFAGFPAGINAIVEARAVFVQKGVPLPLKRVAEPPFADRRTRGEAALAATSRGSGQGVLDALADVAPDFGGFILDFSYGDVISRDVLSPAHKEAAMIAAATARGTMGPQLAVHVAAGLEVGLSRDEIVEILIQMAVYAGFPAAINGLLVARDVFRRRDAERQALRRKPDGTDSGRAD